MPDATTADDDAPPLWCVMRRMKFASGRVVRKYRRFDGRGYTEKAALAWATPAVELAEEVAAMMRRGTGHRWFASELRARPVGVDDVTQPGLFGGRLPNRTA